MIVSLTINKKQIAITSYPEWWRDRPYETRQPSSPYVDLNGANSCKGVNLCKMRGMYAIIRTSLYTKRGFLIGKRLSL